MAKNLNICTILNSKIIQWLLSVLIGEAAGGNAGNAANVLDLPLIKDLSDIDDNSIYKAYKLNIAEMNFIESQYIR